MNKLTRFERLYVLGQPFLTYRMVRVRKDVKALLAHYPWPTSLLDVGARKSHYTIGLGASIYLLDIPRQTAVQHQLDLGVTHEILGQLRRHRSNVAGYVVGDFLETSLPDRSFDVVTLVEVIEHVDEDARFIAQAFRLLKPGGVLYITTPNGATVPNRNPNHVRHYTWEGLEALLCRFFTEVDVRHGEIMTRCWLRGLGFWKPRQPLRMITGMMANLANHVENRCIRATPLNSARLFATAWKI